MVWAHSHHVMPVNIARLYQLTHLVHWSIVLRDNSWLQGTHPSRDEGAFVAHKLSTNGGAVHLCAAGSLVYNCATASLYDVV